MLRGIVANSATRMQWTLSRTKTVAAFHLTWMNSSAHEMPNIWPGADFEIISTKLEIVIGMVYHYEREPLEPRERIAPWIKDLT
jgi:hypothetical protein